VYGLGTRTLSVASLNTTLRACSATTLTTGQASVYGTHFFSLYNSNTQGQVTLAMNEPTSQTLENVTSVSGNPRFTSGGSLILATVGDEVIWTQEDFVIGSTGFANISPQLTGTNILYSSGARWGNHDLYYQIDTGSGFGGTWKNLHQSVLTTETITASVGFRLKIRAVCGVTSTTNVLTFISVYTTSTLAAQRDNLYPLDPAAASLILTGLRTGSEVRIYRESDGVELGGVESSGTSFTFNYDYIGDDINVFIVVHALNYLNIRYDGIFLSNEDINIPVQQQVDRQYGNQ
jgi:hypothetical protein